MREKPNAAPAPSRGRGPGTEEEVAAVVEKIELVSKLTPLPSKESEYWIRALTIVPTPSPAGMSRLSVLDEKFREVILEFRSTNPKGVDAEVAVNPRSLLIAKLPRPVSVEVMPLPPKAILVRVTEVPE
ncbi:MAG: hypothetical protein NTV57_01690 [Cyanobacteria bacterium]|nr:hypothetical protein [Cyanobacteriota bacterium]